MAFKKIYVTYISHGILIYFQSVDIKDIYRNII